MAVAIAFFIVGTLTAAAIVSSGWGPLVLTPWLAPLFLLVGVGLLLGGRAVKKLKNRQHTKITPLQAARVAIFARSSGPVSGSFAGFAAGVALVGFLRVWAPAMATSGWLALLVAVSASFAAVSALISERWCRDDQSEDEDAGRARRGSGGRPAPSGNTRNRHE